MKQANNVSAGKRRRSGRKKEQRKGEEWDLLLDVSGLLAGLEKRARNGKNGNFNTITTLNVLYNNVAPTSVCATGSPTAPTCASHVAPVILM